MQQGLNINDSLLFNDEQKNHANIVLEDSFKEGIKSTNKVTDTISYLQEAKQESKKVSAAIGCLLDYKKGQASSEEVEKRLSVVRELHDKDLAEITQKLNSAAGLDLLEKLLTERSKMNNESIKRGKMTEDESMVYQALYVHDLLVSVKTMEATGDLEKTNKYFREFYPALTDIGTRQYYRTVTNGSIGLLATEGIKIKGIEDEMN